MNSIPFFTPAYYGKNAQSWGHTILEKVDDFFFLGDCCNFSGRKAHVLPGFDTIGKSEGALYKKHTSSYIATAAKVIAYCTVIIPIIALVVKACLRYVYHFHLIETNAGEIPGEAIKVQPSKVFTYASRFPPEWMKNAVEIPDLIMGQLYNLSADEVMRLKIRISQEGFSVRGEKPDDTVRIGFSDLKPDKGSYFEVKVYGSELLEDARFLVTQKEVEK